MCLQEGQDIPSLELMIVSFVSSGGAGHRLVHAQHPVGEAEDPDLDEKRMPDLCCTSLVLLPKAINVTLRSTSMAPGSPDKVMVSGAVFVKWLLEHVS